MLLPESRPGQLAGVMLAHRVLLAEILARLSDDEVADILQSVGAYAQMPDFGAAIAERNPGRAIRIQRALEAEINAVSELVE